ncbi:Disease resistance response protein [Sesamum alatum]|uniref:Dirigent protein n=1 Tax=Sesamum alatum TaxID=300844 RepID=A0AAE1YSK1_9LAMI|nr:Disease resistance response protein [Sesamum alatum]
MATKTQAAALFLCLLISASSATAYSRKTRRPRTPCRELTFFFHDVLFNGHNHDNATAVIVGSPQWGNKTAMAKPYNFGDLMVFDDPITLDNNFHGTPVGRAQGMYFYDQWSIYGSWVGFSFLFNSTEYVGTLNFAGANPLMNKTRDISVIGGTGDFFMARGVATLTCDAFEGDVYFRLRVDIKLYEC